VGGREGELQYKIMFRYIGLVTTFTWFIDQQPN
jgi:hypothetical protein